MNRRNPAAIAVGLSALIFACGPPGEVTVSGSGTSTASESSSSTTGNPNCPDVHEGDLDITDTTDIAALRTVRRVTGTVSIKSASLVDLSFLECLEQIDVSLWIQSNDMLVDLHGLENLETVGLGPPAPIDSFEGVYVGGNPNLVSLAGLDRVTYLRQLGIMANVELAHLGLDQLREIERLELGSCYGPMEDSPVPTDSKLTEISGLGSLERLNGLIVGGQNHLLSLGPLHGTMTEATGEITFYYNENLPYSEIEKLANDAGREPEHCGNQDDPVELCEMICPNPG